MNIEIAWQKAKQSVDHNDGRKCFFAGIICLMTEMSKDTMMPEDFLDISRQIENSFRNERPDGPPPVDVTS